jgi:hypothetical protein
VSDPERGRRLADLADRLAQGNQSTQDLSALASEAGVPVEDARRCELALRYLQFGLRVAPPAQAPAPSPGTLGPGATLAGHEILGELGRGGMGTVYLARHPRLDRPVALKVQRGGQGRGERFRREARAAARLQHPNVVAVFDAGEEDGLAWLAMEFVQGLSLDQIVSARGPYPAAEAVALGLTLARALAYVHEQGVLHRDLKPDNVLLDAGDVPRVTDFGLVRLLDEESGLTQTGSLLGTPGYMSPEQAGGRPDAVDVRTDVYGLGATLFALLTGRPPFQGQSIMELMAQIVDGVPPRPSSLAPVPRAVDDVILRCLEKEPADRYPDMAALAEALAACQVTPRPKAAVSPLLAAGALILAGSGFAVGLLVRPSPPLAQASAPHDAPTSPTPMAADVEGALRRLDLGQRSPHETLDALLAMPQDACLKALTRELESLSAGLRSVELTVYLESALELQADEEDLARLQLLLSSLRQGALEAVDQSMLRRLRARALTRWRVEPRDTDSTFLQQLSGCQLAALGEGGVLRAQVVCQALGRLGPSPAAAQALGDYLVAEADPDRAAHAALALIAQGAAEALPHLERVKGRFPLASPRWLAAVSAD